MAKQLPPLKEFLDANLGKGARLAQAGPGQYQDTYLEYICLALETLVGIGEGDGNSDDDGGFNR